MLKRSTVVLTLIQLFLCITFLVNIFVINIENSYIISSFLLLITLIIIGLLGYEKNRQRLKKDAVFNTFILASLLQIILYLSGLLFGFLRNAHSTRFPIIISNTLPSLLLIIVTEILRYVINQKGRESKKLLVFSCITFVIIEFSIASLFYNFSNKKDIIELICLVTLPSIAKNIFLTYNTTRFGFESSMIYRIIIELPTSFIPIIPNISNYLNAIISFLYPLLSLIITKKTIGKINPYNKVIYKKVSRLPSLLAVLVISLIIVLNSGLTPLYVLAIGSGSMEKTLCKGDAVIVQKLNKEQIYQLSKNDILVYKYQSKVVVHRVYSLDIKEGIINIRTKGDNNNYPDTWTINEENVIGKVILKIKYIGIPTIWLNDFIN